MIVCFSFPSVLKGKERGIWPEEIKGRRCEALASIRRARLGGTREERGGEARLILDQPIVYSQIRVGGA